MRIAFYGDSLTDGFPGVSYIKLLQSRWHGYTLINCGRYNDTAISLFRRIVTQRLLLPVDRAFLWVGVNDVLVRRSPMTSRLRRWWARDDEEFRIHYRALLDLLTPFAGTLIAVSPALIGEDPDSPTNEALARLGDIIAKLSAGYARAVYLDLHAEFMQAMRGHTPSSYHPRHPLGGVIDTLTLRTPAAVDQAAAERGLRLSLDGVHLNSRGAAIVADAFDCSLCPADIQEHRPHRICSSLREGI